MKKQKLKLEITERELAKKLADNLEKVIENSCFKGIDIQKLYKCLSEELEYKSKTTQVLLEV